MREFTVVLRAPSSAIIGATANLVVDHKPPGQRPHKVTYRTRYLPDGVGGTFPGDLWIEAIGPADDLEDAIRRFANSALSALPIIGVATNACIRTPEIELAFESTKGVASRPFLQAYIPPERRLPHPVRFASEELVGVLGQAVTNHAQQERIFRACSQYVLALGQWKPGLATMALGHLWMGVEALTKVMLDKALRKEQLSSSKDLVSRWGLDDIKKVDSAVRLRMIFHNDAATYKESVKLSDGLEHGFLEFGGLRDRAEAVRRRTASHLRTAILEASELTPDALARLTSSPYDHALGHSPIQVLAKGEITGRGDQLSRDGAQYPFVRWTPSYKYTIDEDQRTVNFEANDHFEVELAAGLSFLPGPVEVWNRSI